MTFSPAPFMNDPPIRRSRCAGLIKPSFHLGNMTLTQAEECRPALGNSAATVLAKLGRR
jgi:hypothetical protein